MLVKSSLRHFDLSKCRKKCTFALMEQNKITVYKASAGSGKTFTLAASYIELLLNSDDASAFRHTLAVTFTNKATAEMKERIMARLYDLANNLLTPEAEGFRQEMKKRLPHLSDELMQSRAAAALRAILHDYDHFAITTIDSFFQTLLTHLAHELGLSSGFRVDINDGEVVSRAVDRLMEALPTRPKLMAALITYITKRIEDNKNWNPASEMKDLGKHLLKEKVLLHDEQLEEALATPQATSKYAQKLKAILTEALSHITQAADDFLKHYNDATGSEAAYKGVKEVLKYGQRLLTAPAAIDKAEALKEPGKTIQKMIDSTEEWIGSKYKGKHELMATAESLRTELEELDKMRQQVLTVANTYKLSTAQLSPLGLMNEIRTEMNRLNRENNRVLLAKTPQLLNSVVGDNDASFVFERVGTRFRHVMIDEFQDTSVMQWDIFRRLLIESISGLGSCLLVGDVKQSIYRFRNGDWRILQNIESTMGKERVNTHHLDTNFRSGDVIINFNNTFFEKAAKVLDLHAPDTHVSPMYTDVAQKCSQKRGGYVRVRVDIPQKNGSTPEPDESDLPEATNELAMQIRELHQQGLPYQKMGILVRKRWMAEKLIEHFSIYHPDIRLVSDEAFLLSSSPLLQALIHALSYLACPENVVARLHVATYMSRNNAESRELSLPEIIAQAESLLPEVLRGLQTTSTDKTRTENDNGLLALPLYELCERLLTFLSPKVAAEETPYVCCFLDNVMNFIDDGAADINSLLTLWDERLSTQAVPAGETDGVRVLTIHKSKGLAFHTVFLPMCNWELEADRTPSDLQWFKPKGKPYDDIPLLPINAEKATANSIYADSYAEEHRWRRIENLNLLYVAFTRAQYNLYIWSSGKNEFSTKAYMGELIHAALPRPFSTEEETFIVYETGTPSVPADTPKAKRENESGRNPLEESMQSIHITMQSYESRASFRQSNESRDFVSDLDEAQTEQRHYIDQGKLLHKLLSSIHTHDDLPSALAKMVSEGLLTSAEAHQTHKLLHKRMSDPQAADWFDGSWRVFNECSILTHNERGALKTYRPDRVITKNGATIVVDFKFGNPNPLYHDQVKTYMQLLEKMGHTQVSGYLWYVYDGQIVPV